MGSAKTALADLLSQASAFRSVLKIGFHADSYVLLSAQVPAAKSGKESTMQASTRAEILQTLNPGSALRLNFRSAAPRPAGPIRTAERSASPWRI